MCCQDRSVRPGGFPIFQMRLFALACLGFGGTLSGLWCAFRKVCHRLDVSSNTPGNSFFKLPAGMEHSELTEFNMSYRPARLKNWAGKNSRHPRAGGGLDPRRH